MAASSGTAFAQSSSLLVVLSSSQPAAHARPRRPREAVACFAFAVRRRVSPYSPPRPKLSSNGLPPDPPTPPHNHHDHENGDDDRDHTPSNPLALYLHLLSTRPLPTKVATSALLTLLSDLIAQLFELRSHSPPSSRLNPRRLLALFLIGAALTAPLFHVLYHYLELYIPAKASPLNLLLQLTIDQLVAAPLWLLFFFPSVSLLEGRLNPQALRAQVSRDFIPALKLTWTVFPPVQLLSFALLPPVTRLLALNLVDLVFTAALSFIKHRPLPANPA